MSLKEITFKEKRKNHFYAKRNKQGQLELVDNPQIGDKVFEFAAVAGGAEVRQGQEVKPSYRNVLLQVGQPLCETHLKMHKEPFLVKMCSGFSFIAHPIPGLSCVECHKAWSCGGAYLLSADLSHADLSNADLSGADLFDANLSRANLLSADLSRANLLGAYLSRANLFGADLSGADLSGANLSYANLSCANLSRANLLGANLFGANLFGARYNKHTIGLSDEQKQEMICIE